MSIFSSTRKSMVYATTAAGTLFCVAVTFLVDYPGFATLSDAQLRRTLLIDLFLPILLAGPLFYLLMSKIRHLNIARKELEIIASTDSLTAILNRGAFTMLVDAYLDKANKEHRMRPGALLVVDADRFKLINDRLGHRHGDHALQSIARSIRETLREKDLVGRIGGEEFGVFLPGSEPQQAADIAERIRLGVGQIDFRPHGSPYEVSVSIGGVTYERATTYDELFQAADQRLYVAKRNGRNQVRMDTLASFLERRENTARATGALLAS